MNVVGLLARHRKRGAMPAPASVGILNVNQPTRSPPHRLVVGRSELSDTGRQPEQDLAGVEYNWNHRLLADHAARECTAWQLDRYEPVEHALDTGAQQLVLAQLRAAKQGQDDVSRRLWVRCAPSTGETEVARHAAIARARAVLSVTQ